MNGSLREREPFLAGTGHCTVNAKDRVMLITYNDVSNPAIDMVLFRIRVSPTHPDSPVRRRIFRFLVHYQASNEGFVQIIYSVQLRTRGGMMYSNLGVL